MYSVRYWKQKNDFQLKIFKINDSNFSKIASLATSSEQKVYDI